MLLGLGLWLLLGRGKLALMAASRVHVNPRRNLGNVVAFGAAYSISSLSCTLPIFLAVVGIGLGTPGTRRRLQPIHGLTPWGWAPCWSR